MAIRNEDENSNSNVRNRFVYSDRNLLACVGLSHHTIENFLPQEKGLPTI